MTQSGHHTQTVTVVTLCDERGATSVKSGALGMTSDGVRFPRRSMMDTVLFTDYGIVVFAITTSAIALILSVLGLAQRV